MSTTSPSTKIAPSPGVIPVQNVATTSARENTVTTDSFAATPAPPSSVPLKTTASPNTTLILSATTQEPQTSKTTAAPTNYTTIPATTQITTAEQTTLSSFQKAIFQLWQYINKITNYISDIINSINI